MTTGAGSTSTGGVGVAVSPEEIATWIINAYRPQSSRAPMTEFDRAAVQVIATALRAAEARGREEAAKIADGYVPPTYEHAATTCENIASAIRSLNAPQSPTKVEQ